MSLEAVMITSSQTPAKKTNWWRVGTILLFVGITIAHLCYPVILPDDSLSDRLVWIFSTCAVVLGALVMLGLAGESILFENGYIVLVSLVVTAAITATAQAWTWQGRPMFVNGNLVIRGATVRANPFTAEIATAEFLPDNITLRGNVRHAGGENLFVVISVSLVLDDSRPEVIAALAKRNYQDQQNFCLGLVREAESSAAVQALKQRVLQAVAVTPGAGTGRFDFVQGVTNDDLEACLAPLLEKLPIRLEQPNALAVATHVVIVPPPPPKKTVLNIP